MNPSPESTFVCPIIIEDDRTGLDTETIRRALRDNLLYYNPRSFITALVNHPTNLSKKRCQNRLLSLGRIFSRSPFG